MGEFETAWVPLFLELSAILLARLLESRSFNSLRDAGGYLVRHRRTAVAQHRPGAAGVFAVRDLACAEDWQWAAIAMGAALITIGPWLVRNLCATWRICFVRDNFGLELYVSNNDYAVAELELNDVSQFYQREHPFTTRKSRGNFATGANCRSNTTGCSARSAGFARTRRGFCH